jgi:hypothetical protein
MRHTLFIIIGTLAALSLQAQTDSLRMHSTLYGVGAANVYDSYLSPYSYTGIEARIMRQTQRQTRLCRRRITYATEIDFNAAITKSPARNVKTYAAGIRYSNAWLYNLPRPRQLRLAAGLAASAYAGCVYNERNGNNPAQAKADLMIDLTAQATYPFRVGRRQWTARYRLAVPLCGIAFAPQYGQAYYEIFVQKDYDHNCLFANFINTPSMRHLLTVDIPLGHNQLRLGYAAEFMQSRWNGLRYHSYSHNFVIGFTKYFIRK